VITILRVKVRKIGKSSEEVQWLKLRVICPTFLPIMKILSMVTKKQRCLEIIAVNQIILSNKLIIKLRII
jgi:hypothetical protein